MPNINIKDLTVKYIDKNKNQTIALDNFSATFESEKINVIVGFSGSGKTTLLNSVAGLLNYLTTIVTGDIYFDDKDISDTDTKDRNISYVSQEFSVYPHMTIYDNIAFPLYYLKWNRGMIDEAVKQVAKDLDIYHCLSRKPKHISIGQAQRASLARSIVKKPSLLLLDEPLSNVDEATRHTIRRLIKDIVKKYNITVLYVTHNFSDAMFLADKLFVLNEGKLEVSGSPLDVYKSDSEIIKYMKESIKENEL